MDTRALKNPYVDYDGSAALTQSLFDSSGQVKLSNDYHHHYYFKAPHQTFNPFVLLLLLFAIQLTPEFSQRLRTTISELLAVMENGLRSADPRDCTAYTGWAGDETVGRENPGHWRRRQVAPLPPLDGGSVAAPLKVG